MSVPDHGDTYAPVTLVDVDLALLEYRREPCAYSLEQLKCVVERLRLLVSPTESVADLVPEIGQAGVVVPASGAHGDDDPVVS